MLRNGRFKVKKLKLFLIRKNHVTNEISLQRPGPVHKVTGLLLATWLLKCRRETRPPQETKMNYQVSGG